MLHLCSQADYSMTLSKLGLYSQSCDSGHWFHLAQATRKHERTGDRVVWSGHGNGTAAVGGFSADDATRYGRCLWRPPASRPRLWTAMPDAAERGGGSVGAAPHDRCRLSSKTSSQTPVSNSVPMYPRHVKRVRQRALSRSLESGFVDRLTRRLPQDSARQRPLHLLALDRQARSTGTIEISRTFLAPHGKSTCCYASQGCARLKPHV